MNPNSTPFRVRGFIVRLMGASSGSSTHPTRQPPWPKKLQTVSSDPRLSPEVPRSNSDQIHESPAESASSQETWPIGDRVMGKKMQNGKADNNIVEQPVIHHLSSAGKISLRDIARDRIEVIADKMHRLPEYFLENLKNELRTFLIGNGSAQ